MKGLLLFSADQLWVRQTPEGPSWLFDADPLAFDLVEPLSAPTTAGAGERVFAAESAEAPVPGAERMGLRALFDLVTPQRYARLDWPANSCIGVVSTAFAVLAARRCNATPLSAR